MAAEYIVFLRISACLPYRPVSCQLVSCCGLKHWSNRSIDAHPTFLLLLLIYRISWRTGLYRQVGGTRPNRGSVPRVRDRRHPVHHADGRDACHERLQQVRARCTGFWFSFGNRAVLLRHHAPMCTQLHNVGCVYVNFGMHNNDEMN